MKAELPDTIARAGGNRALHTKGTVTYAASLSVLPFWTDERYPKHSNLKTEVNGESRIPTTQNATFIRATGDSLNPEMGMATQLP